MASSKEANLRSRRKKPKEGQQQQQQQNECAPSWSWRDPEIWIFISMLVIITISLSYLFHVGGFKEETINGDGSEAVGGQTNVIQPAVNGIKDAQQQPRHDEVNVDEDKVNGGSNAIQPDETKRHDHHLKDLNVLESMNLAGLESVDDERFQEALAQLRAPELNGRLQNHAKHHLRSYLGDWEMKFVSVERCNVAPGLKQRWNKDMDKFGPTKGGTLKNLWHGTDAAAANSIATGGFNMGFASNQKFGFGNYFGTFDLAMKYSFRKKEQQPGSDVWYSYLLLSKVLLPPNKEEGRDLHSVKADEYFWAVIDGRNKVFIVDDDKALPVFLFKLEWKDRSLKRI